MKVEIAIITHNREKQLYNLLYDIENQTFGNIVIKIYASGYTQDQLDKLKENYQVFPQPDMNDFGHEKRAIALKNCDVDYIVTVNDDDQYSHVFVDIMLKEAVKSGADVTYCDFGLGDRDGFITESKLARSYITNGSMLITRNVAIRYSYPYRDRGADWHYVEDLIAKGVKFHRVPKVLFFGY